MREPDKRFTFDVIQLETSIISQIRSKSSSHNNRSLSLIRNMSRFHQFIIFSSPCPITVFFSSSFFIHLHRRATSRAKSSVVFPHLAGAPPPQPTHNSTRAFVAPHQMWPIVWPPKKCKEQLSPLRFHRIEKSGRHCPSSLSSSHLRNHRKGVSTQQTVNALAQPSSRSNNKQYTLFQTASIESHKIIPTALFVSPGGRSRPPPNNQHLDSRKESFNRAFEAF